MMDPQPGPVGDIAEGVLRRHEFSTATEFLPPLLEKSGIVHREEVVPLADDRNKDGCGSVHVGCRWENGKEETPASREVFRKSGSWETEMA